ncbi:hypothetical protein J4E93_004859 [Alternaria ventricosa]|uniref:uncharacterized protein n=1 Tax=Alternaria ventricosa TaxID=1187951 RepID=UPI0020C40ADF|nr:uncharacterized protein J4E93_004859 [Alternaria ventricosa]KAI4646637.1 hypothetical protein J4E93_004859 [Alternaria ventricosa]
MRLLRRSRDGKLEFTKDLPEDARPKYAILSHTWLRDDDQELTFKDVLLGVAEKKPAGYAKIRFCEEQAARDGLEHFWVDTCCINKHNAVELQEAINSFFTWYRNATKSYAYLTDVHTCAAGEDHGQSKSSTFEFEFRNSNWFKRGWTLQELLAPKSVDFFSADGEKLGDRDSLEDLIFEATDIPRDALQGAPLESLSIEERLSWTKNRVTKRKEDRAYCLFGIFNVFMPTIYGEGDHAMTRLQREINTTDDVEMDRLLSTLPTVSDAAFNSRNTEHEATCLPNTRVELIREIEQWAQSPEETCVFWLKGLAGTGKSTVARTVARDFSDRGNLGATFFFSEGGGDRRNADKFMTTLAWQLANNIPSAKRYVCEAIKEQTDIVNASLRDQWAHLVLGPLSKLDIGSSPSPIILIVDALDECAEERDIRVILRVLATASSLTKIRLRVLVTSRPETPIHLGFDHIPDAEQQVYALHEIPEDLVNRDLMLFFEENFTHIRKERGLSFDWPARKTIERLVEISYGLFIWASTACRYIRAARILTLVKKRISKLIHGDRGGLGPEQQLDQIYTTVLRDAVPEDCDDDEKQEFCEELREVLGSVVLLFFPLPMNSLAALLEVPFLQVQETLHDLRSIFYIPNDISSPIRLHHPTFRDFLLDESRCSDTNFLVNEKETHQALAHSCINVMSKMLKRDICNLESPGTLVKDVDPDRIRACIPPELQYACLYWVQHCKESGAHLTDDDVFHEFLQTHFLHWLEVICLLGKSHEMSAIIRLYHSLLVAAHNKRQGPFVKSARQFFLAYESVNEQAPLQIYCAALLFIPSTNELKKHFRTLLHPCVREFRIAEAAIPPAKDEFNYVNDLAFTPDGKQIASGSNVAMARLWNVATGATISTFEGSFTDKISSIAISADGKLLAGGSDDFRVVVWNLQTREVRYALEEHTGWINSVVFSPDGKVLASGSMDANLILTDAATGKELRRINNQGANINSATFAPNGSLIAIGSVDRMVRLWDISRKTSDMRAVLDGHSGAVNSVRFSPTAPRLISSSDDMTVKLWDTVKEVEIKTFRGHTRRVMALMYSRDSLFFVSGSEDKTVRVWDPNSGATLHTIDHASGINALTFSPDGQLLAAGTFDDEVRLWDTRTWTLREKLDDFEHGVPDEMVDSVHIDELNVTEEDSKGHSSTVNCLLFSPDGRTMASGSEDATIRIWPNGAEGSRKLKGHSKGIACLAFSPNSRLLASASSDHTVILWDVDLQEALYTFNGDESAISNIRFSPDSRLLASCSANGRTTVWDTARGTIVGMLEAHTLSCNDIAFSPDSKILASCSTDGTVALWNVVIAFSFNGALVASSSEDATIRLWNRDGSSNGTIPGCTHQAKSVAFAPDDRWLVSCSADGTLWLYKITEL